MPAVTLSCHTRFMSDAEVVEDNILKLSDSSYLAEMEKGFHPESGKPGFKQPMYGEKVPMSAALNHCHLIKSTKKMAKAYLDFWKDAGASEEELEILGSKIEIFETASDSDTPGGDESKFKQPKKKLKEMSEEELQAIAQQKKVVGWDTMGRKELIKALSK